MTERTDIMQLKAVNGLVGTFRHSLDPKKRLTIPSEWREALGNPSYIYVMPSASADCLELVPAELMERTVARYQAADLLDEDADNDAQAIGEISQMLKIDSAGRVRICDELLRHAGVEGSVTLIGCMRKARLWAAERRPVQPDGKIDLSAFRAVVEKRKKMARKNRQEPAAP